jgi:hypothetical protein
MSGLKAAHQFYTTAAKKSDGLCKKKLLLSIEWTIARTKEIEALNKNKNSNDALNKLTMSLQAKRKRKLHEEPTDRETKKIKKNLSIQLSHNEIKSIGCEHLLNEFTQVRINDNLDGISKSYYTKSLSLNECHAIACNNYAITIIKDLSDAKKNCSNSEKIHHLEKAKEKFSNSSKFYTQAGLLKEKGKIEHCINILKLSIKKLSCDNATKVDNQSILDDKRGYSP